MIDAGRLVTNRARIKTLTLTGGARAATWLIGRSVRTFRHNHESVNDQTMTET